ncbi:MAG: hypothetical protein LAO19_21510 [Acidobacteriia bacterium]|nr:hypothetical protein [Terriglobia bacterium]
MKTMKNRSIEIHDSVLQAISFHHREAVLDFSSVYIHESAGTPGVDPGSGWVQKALLRISDASLKRSFPEFPADLLHGQIMLSDSILVNTIPIPLRHEGIVELKLETWNNEVVLISGSRVKLELIGEPEYVEEFRRKPRLGY